MHKSNCLHHRARQQMSKLGWTQIKKAQQNIMVFTKLPHKSCVKQLFY